MRLAIKAFGRNDSVLAAFNEENERVFRTGVYANNYSMLLMPLTGVLGNFFVIANSTSASSKFIRFRTPK